MGATCEDQMAARSGSFANSCSGRAFPKSLTGHTRNTGCGRYPSHWRAIARQKRHNAFAAYNIATTLHYVELHHGRVAQEGCAIDAPQTSCERRPTIRFCGAWDQLYNAADQSTTHNQAHLKRIFRRPPLFGPSATSRPPACREPPQQIIQLCHSRGPCGKVWANVGNLGRPPKYLTRSTQNAYVFDRPPGTSNLWPGRSAQYGTCCLEKSPANVITQQYRATLDPKSGQVVRWLRQGADRVC